MAILKNFDVIGWYENGKNKEIRKDFYLRALFPYKVENFTALIKNHFPYILLEELPNIYFKIVTLKI